MTPSNAIYRGIYKLSKSIHDNTVDFIDGTDEEVAKLPVVYIGEGDNSDSGNKDMVGVVNQTVHIYGKVVQRKELDEIVGRLRNGMLLGLTEYGYRLTSPKVKFKTLNDKSMGQTLIHIVLEYSTIFTKIIEEKEPEEPIVITATIDKIESGGTIITGTATKGERILIFVSGSSIFSGVKDVSEDGKYRYDTGYIFKGGETVMVLWLKTGKVLAEYKVPEEGEEELEETPIEDFIIYTYADGRPYIGEYIGKSQRIKIPMKYRGKDIESINTEGLKGRGLTEVVLPENLKSIGISSLSQNSIKEIIIPKSVLSIRRAAFSNNSIRKLELPEGLGMLEESAFRANSIEELGLPGTLKIINNYTFESNIIKSIKFSLGIEEIRNYAFMNNAIRDLVLPETLKIIGDNSFSGNSMRNVDIPEGVVSIGRQAFANNSLDRVVIPQSVNTIGSEAFDNGVEIIEEDSLEGRHIGQVLYSSKIREEENKDVVIEGYRGTIAEKYALENGHTFVEIEDNKEDKQEEIDNEEYKTR